ncbi:MULTISPECIES: acylphosphatase [unclassified Ligilactobacillus]|uniref:acylphosphatase n=1 Tax=unclassified Ligilactobacillus TaxID=2767920 RepID=UPI003853FA07
MEEAVHLNVSGLVQGVGFRYSTKALADELGIKGTVCNLPNGTVDIIAQGNAQLIRQFIKQVQACPTPAGHVTHLTSEKIAPASYNDFRVTYY